jgi:hypothetical protein
MKEIYTNLFIGDDNDCFSCDMNPEFSIVHACKTCHQNAIGYKGSLPTTHQYYLIYEKDTHLYLNMVDMPNEFLSKYTNPIFKRAMYFINREMRNKKVLIHCNLGHSRSPSLGLVYLATKGIISVNSYEIASNEFAQLYPKFSPGMGIMLYMQHNWDYLMAELVDENETDEE